MCYSPFISKTCHHGHFSKFGCYSGVFCSHLFRGTHRSFSSSSAAAQPSVSVQHFDNEAYHAAIGKGFSDFEANLTLGGDDRSLILDAGTNKYHIKPQPVDAAHVFRGSCTGNPPTQRGYDASEELFAKLSGLEGESLSTAVQEVFDDQRARLTKLLELPEGTEVIICPSGSDAEYIPLAIARALKGDDILITNGVTQLSEIGAGTAPASTGEYFSTHVPLMGRLPEEAPAILSGFEGITGAAIPARDKEGNVIDASNEMDKFLDAALDIEAYPIIHGVFGGKTGLRDVSSYSCTFRYLFHIEQY